MVVLSLDAGSSTLKYALFRAAGDGALERIATETVLAGNGGTTEALVRVWSALEARSGEPISAVGHRIVFGGPAYDAPTRVDSIVLQALEALIGAEPLHLRAELDLVHEVARRLPNVPQVLCFDTAFHQRMPALAKRLPLPRDLDPMLRRYGFHGLSYEYVVSQLDGAPGKTIVAHLGSGASLCAISDGRPLDTTMGFSALGGLMMGTRPGDLDPGVLLRLIGTDGYDRDRLTDLLNHGCGLLGVSGTTADMQVLLAAADRDLHAREAVELFVYQLIKHLGACVAVLGGLDTIVFTGGIGENAPPIRAAACAAFGYLGLALDSAANARSAPVISQPESTVTVKVIRTDENLVIARHTLALMTCGAPSNTEEKIVT